MALPTLADIKLILRKQTTDEDVEIEGMRTRAIALLVGWLGRPYEAVERTWVDEGGMVRAYGSLRSLMVPTVPFDPASLTIEDADGLALVLTDEYRAPRAWDAVIRAAAGTTFPNPPYTLTANVGLSASYGSDGQVDYLTVIEPALSQAVIDIVADFYQRRDAAATSDTAGGGPSGSWNNAGIPDRVCTALAPYKSVRVV